MKRFISTKLFRTLQEASRKSIEADAEVLENGYDEFVLLLFSTCAAFNDKTAHYNTLIYTHTELSELTGSSGGKNRNLSQEIPQTCRIRIRPVKTKGSVSRTVYH